MSFLTQFIVCDNYLYIDYTITCLTIPVHISAAMPGTKVTIIVTSIFGTLQFSTLDVREFMHEKVVELYWTEEIMKFLSICYFASDTSFCVIL